MTALNESSVYLMNTLLHYNLLYVIKVSVIFIIISQSERNGIVERIPAFGIVYKHSAHRSPP